MGDVITDISEEFRRVKGIRFKENIMEQQRCVCERHFRMAPFNKDFVGKCLRDEQAPHI